MSPVLVLIQDQPALVLIQDQSVLVLIQDQSVLVLIQDQSVLVLIQDQSVLVLIQDQSVLVLIQDQSVLVIIQDQSVLPLASYYGKIIDNPSRFLYREWLLILLQSGMLSDRTSDSAPLPWKSGIYHRCQISNSSPVYTALLAVPGLASVQNLPLTTPMVLYYGAASPAI